MQYIIKIEKVNAEPKPGEPVNTLVFMQNVYMKESYFPKYVEEFAQELSDIHRAQSESGVNMKTEK